MPVLTLQYENAPGTWQSIPLGLPIVYDNVDQGERHLSVLRKIHTTVTYRVVDTSTGEVVLP